MNSSLAFPNAKAPLSNKETHVNLRCSKIGSGGTSNTPRSLKLQKQTWLCGAHFYCLGYQFLYVKKTDPNIMEQRITRSTLPKGFLETPDQLSFTPVVLTLRGSIMRLCS